LVSQLWNVSKRHGKNSYQNTSRNTKEKRWNTFKTILTPLNSHDLDWGKFLQSPKVSLEGIQVLTISIRTHVRHIEHQKDDNSGWNVLHVNSCVIQMFHFKLFRWHSKQSLWKDCTDFDKKQFTARNVRGDWRHQLQENWCTLQFEVLWIK